MPHSGGSLDSLNISLKVMQCTEQKKDQSQECVSCSPLLTMVI